MNGTDSGVVRVVVALAVVLAAGCQGQEEPTSIVEIVTVPEGAEVSFSGRNLGLAPVSVTDVIPGTYIVRAKKPEFETWSELVEVVAGLPKITVRAELRRRTTLTTVKSTPPQTQFYHEDGTLIGVTPFDDYAPTGRYRMRFSKENYHDEVVNVNIEPDITKLVNATLLPMKASITVTTNPSRATVFVDEIERGGKTPNTFVIDAGLRTIGVALAGYSREEKDLQVGPNASLTEHFDLVPGNVPAGMVKVPEGESIMGCNTESPDEAPRHKVVVKTFYIDKFEVTNARYKRFKETHTFPPELANHPVVNVTWHEAVAYADSLGKRLPTEIEWEKAATGGDGRPYPWGNVFDDSFCNVKGSVVGLLKAVGKLPEGRSPFGCYDMAGNVWEWAADSYGPYPGAEMSDTYGQQFRVMRGGAYTETSFHARCSNRAYEWPNVGRPDVGFRCADDPGTDVSDESVSGSSVGAPAAG